MSLRAPSKCFFAAAMYLLLVAGCEKPSAMNESTANVRHIAQGEFAEQVTAATGPVVVDFYATWCGLCRELSPILDSAAGSFAGKIRFFKVNVDESPGLAQNFQAQPLPAVLLFKDGKLVGRISGVPTEADLKIKFASLVGGK